MTASTDEFGDRMKVYEGLTNPSMLPRVPVCARLDGRTFHAFTKYAERPFSRTFHEMMAAVTEHLVVESAAAVGYTQSDEITLCWVEHPFFEGNVHKMVSTLAAMASVHLHSLSFVTTGETMGDLVTWRREVESGLRWSQSPTFDCRVWALPSLVEAANVFLWRQQDASRNSVQMAARHHLGHAKCDSLNTKELQEALFHEARDQLERLPGVGQARTFREARQDATGVLGGGDRGAPAEARCAARPVAGGRAARSSAARP